ncbi:MULTISPECIES: hypothetical protein [Xanthomonas translucens group]|uniref:hypothetical protein n=1 Tax=Xanthomonas translucens group TaxID=3390202 RepID=UPI000A79D9B0|nr:hypothetical protein [Xanthomonas translucens]UKE49137.1 hypothetical protein KHA79_07060 [Xanthomonas translucens pv. cerealis]
MPLSLVTGIFHFCCCGVRWGYLLLFAPLHLACAVGKLHDMLAKHLLVHSAAQ